MECKKITILSYIKMDLYRSIFTWRFFAGILGVFLVMIIATFEDINLDSSVVYIFYLVTYGMIFLMTYIFCTFVYGGCFCEDYENKYISIQVIRGSLKQYVLSKVLIIFFTSILVMTFGILIYILFIRYALNTPWIKVNDNMYEDLMHTGGFRNILKRQQFILYYILYGIQAGALAGILSLISSYVSLYIPNKLLLVTVPSMSFYFLNQFISRMGFPFYSIFDAKNTMCNNYVLSLFCTLGITLVCLMCMYYAIYKKIKGRIKNE